MKLDTKEDIHIAWAWRPAVEKVVIQEVLS